MFARRRCAPARMLCGSDASAQMYEAAPDSIARGTAVHGSHLEKACQKRQAPERTLFDKAQDDAILSTLQSIS